MRTMASPVSRLFAQPFSEAQIKESIKAPRHWPLGGESTGDTQRASNEENDSIWWRHHQIWFNYLATNDIEYASTEHTFFTLADPRYFLYDNVIAAPRKIIITFLDKVRKKLSLLTPLLPQQQISSIQLTACLFWTKYARNSHVAEKN